MANKYYQANELYQSLDEIVDENARLTLKLQVYKTESGVLKSANERLEIGFLAVTEKLEIANNEIDRLRMMRHRNQKNLEAIKRLGRPG